MVRDSVGILKKLTIALNIIRVKSLPIVDYTGTKWGWKNYNLPIINAMPALKNKITPILLHKRIKKLDAEFKRWLDALYLFN